MRALRDRDTGCAWDLEQNFSTIAPYTVEEAYEVADAVERGDMADLRDELGDFAAGGVSFANGERGGPVRVRGRRCRHC